MPGIDGLSKAGLPSGFITAAARVVRKPPEAGPKPTHTISASMVGRSIGSAGYDMGCGENRGFRRAISNLKFQISNFKSQISNLKFPQSG
jgi:hypothetical protein